MIRGTILSIPDSKRHLCLLAAAYIAGVLFYCRQGSVWLPLGLITGGGSIVILLFAKEKKEAAVSIGLIAALFFLALFRCGYDSQLYEKHLEAAATVTVSSLTGKLYKKEVKTSSYLYYLKSTKFGKVIVYTEEDSAKIGSVVTVSGDVDLFPSAKNEGNFDQAAYYRSRNIVCRMFADSVVCEKKTRWNVKETLFVLQCRLSAVYEEELNERDAGILCTLVLGNKALLEDEVRDLFQDAGISHILAISGLHISILGLGMFRFLRKLRCPYPVAAAAGSAAVVSFALMSGMAVSARRALVMYLLIMGAMVLGRAYDGVNALALAVLLILYMQPLALFQSGFQFSCVSLVGIQFSIALFSGKQQKRAAKETVTDTDTENLFLKIRGKLAGIGHSLCSNLMSGVILQLFLLPLTAWHDYEVPLYSIFLNLLVLPLCSWLLGFGLLGGVTGLVFPEVSKWMLIVCHLILSFYEKLIGAANLLPFSQVITGKPDAWAMFLYYVTLVSFCLAMIERKHQMDSFGKCKFLFVKSLAVSVFGMLSVLLFVPKPENMQIDFLDVSQGDGIYLADGSGRHVMIDGGSTDESEVGRYRIEPFLKYHGVKKINAWIITHSDTDHCSGALELLESGYPVECLVLARAMPDDASRQSLIDAAEDNGTEVVWVDAGDALNMSGCEMTCLYPDAELDASADGAADVNALSQVWRFQMGEFSVLFTGDIGTDTEEILLERGILSESTVLKVAHHGSKNSSLEEFLKEVSPKYAVISSGEGNSYGHPNADTLKRLAGVGSEIYNTQDCGQISLLHESWKWVLKPFVQVE